MLVALLVACGDEDATPDLAPTPATSSHVQDERDLSAAAASATPATPSVARVEVTRSDTTFPIGGTDAVAIFESIEANAPTVDGLLASGVTEATWSFRTEPPRFDAACEVESVVIELEITVILPEHEAPSTLTPALRARLDAFIAAVDRHEERHVDLWLEGAERFRARAEEIVRETPGCSAANAALGRAFREERIATNDAQEAFHAEDGVRVEETRAPFRERLEELETRVDALDVERRALDALLEDLRTKIERVDDGLATIDRDFPGRTLPAPVYEQWADLVNERSMLVEEFNRAVVRRNATSRELRAILDEALRLEEEIRWIA